MHSTNLLVATSLRNVLGTKVDTTNWHFHQATLTFTFELVSFWVIGGHGPRISRGQILPPINPPPPRIIRFTRLTSGRLTSLYLVTFFIIVSLSLHLTWLLEECDYNSLAEQTKPRSAKARDYPLSVQCSTNRKWPTMPDNQSNCNLFRHWQRSSRRGRWSATWWRTSLTRPPDPGGSRSRGWRSRWP